MGTPAPDAVKRLVDRFDRYRKVFLPSSPPIRHSDFDIRTYPGMPVIHEESIKVAGATKAPDYTFAAFPATNISLERFAA